MKTRSLGPWLPALACAMTLAIVLAGSASAERYNGGNGWHGGGNSHGGSSWHEGGGGRWRGGGWRGGASGWHGGYGHGWGWGGVVIAPQFNNTCSYAYCYGYAPRPYRPYYQYPPPVYYGY